ncbi:MAG: TetR family transcriptional regulator [Comamonadaceae bacterium]|nr:MAG: TetR family transcriptional regulator [Comamonadaceae bacterium]
MLARRTKEDALATRNSLLDAAELLFQAQGVSNTSLNDIARQAGTSRGAIYWHFQDKADLFNAMMERVTLPFEQVFEDLGKYAGDNPLQGFRAAMRDALRLISTDERTRRVFEVATHKVEYVDELHAVRLRHLAVCKEFLKQMEYALGLAAKAQKLTLPIDVSNAALGLHALIDGMIQNWLLDSGAFDLAGISEKLIDIYLAGLGFRDVST